ncbi:MAG: glycosyltransferase family 39 protein [Saprospiraceae bacterium]|nr:glycosyltransferase family 39 protein [Saprospiraceae bacterium]
MLKRITWLHILLLLAAIKLMLHFCTNTLWSLHRDALLYLALSRHLDWGFASVPPSIAAFSWIASNILGGSVFAVRLFPTIISTLTVILTGMMAYEMIPGKSGDKRGLKAAVLIGVAGLTSGAFLRPGMLMQPVVFDIFYWTLICWLVLKYINTENTRWILWLGVAIGFGLLNKYSIAFIIAGLLPWLLLTKQRKLFSTRDFYVALILAGLIFLPNFIWQIQHQLPVMRHMRELAATQFVNVTISGFLMDQLFFFLPALPLWLLGLYYLLFTKAGRKWKGFAWLYFSVLLLMILLKGKSYYTIGTYPVLIAAGAAFFEKLTTNRSWILAPVSGLMLLIAIPQLPVILPVYRPEKEAAFFAKRKNLSIMQSALRWEDGKLHPLPQDFSDMLGWEEIAHIVGEAWESIPDKSKAAIYAENYGLAGAIEHFGKSYDLPEVLSFSDNYRYWLPDSLPSDFHTLIYVNTELGDDMHGFFQHLTKIGSLHMPLSRQDGTLVYLCEGPTAAFFERIDGAIRNAKHEIPIDR